MYNLIELRLEEDSRLLDIRGHKISQLEAQLKNIAYGTSKVQIEAAAEKAEEIEFDIANGIIYIILINKVKISLIFRLKLDYLMRMPSDYSMILVLITKIRP
jgi:hypothetical protein